MCIATIGENSLPMLSKENVSQSWEDVGFTCLCRLGRIDDDGERMMENFKASVLYEQEIVTRLAALLLCD